MEGTRPAVENERCPVYRRRAPRWVEFLARSNRYLSQDLFGGPKRIKMAWVINLQKGATGLFVLGLMVHFDNYTTAAWTYLALHGSYGLIWLLKHLACRDRNWETRVTYGGAFAMWAGVLAPYWVAPYLLISGVLGPEHRPASGWVLASCIALHTLGVAIMVMSDAQKNVTLSVRPGLITTGMFARVRHPNYLGEMMIYGSYALLVGHWIPWAILLVIWTGLFYPNMIMKEVSLSRYPQWPAYEARTGMLLPRLRVATSR